LCVHNFHFHLTFIFTFSPSTTITITMEEEYLQNAGIRVVFGSHTFQFIIFSFLLHFCAWSSKRHRFLLLPRNTSFSILHFQISLSFFLVSTIFRRFHLRPLPFFSIYQRRSLYSFQSFSLYTIFIVDTLILHEKMNK